MSPLLQQLCRQSPAIFTPVLHTPGSVAPTSSLTRLPFPRGGKNSDIWGRRPLMLVATAIFFAGSLICAVGDGIALFLFGRAVQGLGAAGLITLVNICVSDLFSLRDRGLYFGIISVVWALASGIGPVLGGLFTQKARCVRTITSYSFSITSFHSCRTEELVQMAKSSICTISTSYLACRITCH